MTFQRVVPKTLALCMPDCFSLHKHLLCVREQKTALEAPATSRVKVKIAGLQNLAFDRTAAVRTAHAELGLVAGHAVRGHLVLRRIHQLASWLVLGLGQHLGIQFAGHVLFVEQWRLAGRTAEAALVPVAIQSEQGGGLRRRLRSVFLDLHTAAALSGGRPRLVQNRRSAQRLITPRTARQIDLIILAS